jgi:ABC-2 type transport system ATP-binding protein
LISVYDYHKAYREKIAVAGLSFAVQPGQILGLLGPNGAGKTTTMRAISGIITPTSGRLLVDGHDVIREPVAAKSALAYVPDDPHLFDTLTVWEHLEFIAAAYRVSNFAFVAEALLDRFQLAEQRNTVAQELSRGMRQKVAICCAYLHNPKAILFDEPMTGLDPRGIRTMKETVIERAQAGTAFLVSSHLLALVEDLCTHLLILHLGKCLFFGPMQDARTAFAAAGADASLEELFFRGYGERLRGRMRSEHRGPDLLRSD